MWHLLSQAFWANLEPPLAFARALPLLERALAIDPNDAMAHVLKSVFFVGLYERRWQESTAMMERATQLGPNLPEAYLYLGLQQLLLGRLPEAVTATRTALHLDPVSPTNAAYAACWMAHAGAYAEGVAELGRLIDMHPGHWVPRALRGPLLARDDLAAGVADADAAVALSDGAAWALSFAACLHYAIGDARGGDELAARLQAEQEHGYVSPTLLSWPELARGRRESAFALLQRAREIHDPILPFTQLGHITRWPTDPELLAQVSRLVL